MKELLADKASVSTSEFGLTKDGESVAIFTLTNANGLQVGITNYGGTVVSLIVPDRDGKFGNIVLAYSHLADYQAGTAYLGALIGRYSNRIAGGRFELGGETYTLVKNNGPNHLHGGKRGFDKVVWEADPHTSIEGPCLLLRYISKDREEGYPGNLIVEVRYTLTHDDELILDYRALTDKATPVNLTSHCYFNLSGDTKRDIVGHQLQIPAHYFTPVDGNSIPTGEYCPVDGSPFDFRTAKFIGDGIDSNHEQIKLGNGYDHNWVLDQVGDGQKRNMAVVAEPVSGRMLKVYSTEPGLQFYSGNFLSGSNIGKEVSYENRFGLCLETQHFPNSPNQPNFPSTILQPGLVYVTQTIYSFLTTK